MNLKISDIMFKNFKKVGLFNSVKELQKYVSSHNFDFFPVYDREVLKGVVTYKELMCVHPNRIVADIKIKPAITISKDEVFWKGLDYFNRYRPNVILATEGKEVVGVVTECLLKAEIAKHTDFLTGLYRSSFIHYKINELIKEKKNFSIVFIDINRFGYIDKEYGHIEGDKLLMEFSDILKKSLPDNCFVSRFGGDEFVVLIKNPFVKAEKYINYLKEIVDKHKFSNNINVHFAAGIVVVSHTSEKLLSNPLSIINKASLICSKAKKNKLPYIMLNNAITSPDVIIS